MGRHHDYIYQDENGDICYDVDKEGKPIKVVEWNMLELRLKL